MSIRNKLGLRGSPGGEEVNPLEGVANLADVMLVLACGLMLALVINWNVDIAPKNPESADTRGEELTEMEFSGSDKGEELDTDTDFEELGVVYRDPVTGKLYLIENGEG